MSDRIEATIEKLTAISSDLKSMLAVHDQRISQQEKTTDELHDTVEKRREELDTKLKDVYDTMRNQDNVVLDHIESLRKESAEQHKILSEKINKLEKAKQLNQIKRQCWPTLARERERETHADRQSEIVVV